MGLLYPRVFASAGSYSYFAKENVKKGGGLIECTRSHPLGIIYNAKANANCTFPLFASLLKRMTCPKTK